MDIIGITTIQYQFKNYDEEFQDGNRRALEQAQDPSELEPGVTALVISHDTGPATNQAK